MRFALPEWVAKPEFYLTLLNLILWILALWGREIRQLIETRATATRTWRRAARLTSFRSELDILNRLHNNAYELVLYVLTELGKMALLAVGFAFGNMMLTRILRPDLTYAGSVREITWAASFVALALASAVGKLYFQFRHLRHYEKRVAYLEKKIAKYT